MKLTDLRSRLRDLEQEALADNGYEYNDDAVQAIGRFLAELTLIEQAKVKKAGKR